MIQPDRIHIGAGVVFVSLCGLARDWGIEEKNVVRMMDKMELPRVIFDGGKKKYVSLYPMEDYFFHLGLPEAYKGDTLLVKAHHELAGVLYGTLTKEVIRQRVKYLAKQLRDKPLTSNKNTPKITRQKK